jgi:hypothetical protein
MHLNVDDIFYSINSHQYVSAAIAAIFRVMLLLQEYMDADKSLARPRRKQVTPTEDFEFHIFYL